MSEELSDRELVYSRGGPRIVAGEIGVHRCRLTPAHLARAPLSFAQRSIVASLPRRKVPFVWNKEEDEKLIALVLANEEQVTMKVALNRTWPAIDARIDRLREQGALPNVHVDRVMQVRREPQQRLIATKIKPPGLMVRPVTSASERDAQVANVNARRTRVVRVLRRATA